MEFILKLIPAIIIAVIVIVLLLVGYVKAPPDQAYIISGLKKEGKILIGRAGIRIPFFERLDMMSGLRFFRTNKNYIRGDSK